MVVVEGIFCGGVSQVRLKYRHHLIDIDSFLDPRVNPMYNKGVSERVWSRMLAVASIQLFPYGIENTVNCGFMHMSFRL